MKTFETPYVDVKKFSVMDILTTSEVSEEETEVPTTVCLENNSLPCVGD